MPRSPAPGAPDDLGQRLDTDLQAASITPATAQHMMVRGLIERDRGATRYGLTDPGARRAGDVAREGWAMTQRQGLLSGKTGKHMLGLRITESDPILTLSGDRTG
jgi:hypothetical protein